MPTPSDDVEDDDDDDDRLRQIGVRRWRRRSASPACLQLDQASKQTSANIHATTNDNARGTYS
uniref:Uncharacterized protein n=1 Tax=Plectus sambesii TaxID=2011161 RepID=A0A914VP89_9BILA